MQQETLTIDEVEAALCIWEAFLEHRENQPRNTALNSLWTEVGTAQMRLFAITMGKDVAAIYETLSLDEREEMETFDWNFVPLAIDEFTYRYVEGKVTLDKSHEEAGRSIVMRRTQNGPTLG